MAQETIPVEPSRTRVLPETYAEDNAVAPVEQKKHRHGGTTLLWLLLLFSLALNGLALYWISAMQQGLQNAQGQLREMISTARTDLQAMGGQPLTLQIAIDQQIPISQTIVISDTFTVPVNTVFPFSTRVTTSINIPLLGPQEVIIPVSGAVPINATFEIPIQMDFPISMTYRLVLDLPVTVTLPSELLQPLDQMLQQAGDGLR